MSSESKKSELLVRLCDYYLECLEHDGGGTAVPARGGDVDYVEIDHFPDSSVLLEDSPEFCRAREKRKSRTAVIYFGYPTSLVFDKKRLEGKGALVIDSVFVFPVETDADSGEHVINLKSPLLNEELVWRYSGGSQADLSCEMAELEHELGISGDDDPPEVDKLVSKLRKIRPEWPWREDMDPSNAGAASESLSVLEDQGVYNRPVFIVAEDHYVRGLKIELMKLKDVARLGPEQIRGTALDAWLEGRFDRATPPDEGKAIIEVFPLNSEQRKAVESSLKNQLTVITGPPGTGKSQVISSLLINADWRGKSVLFSSKVHKAVDVVENRVNNSRHPGPVLIRRGVNARTKLSDHISRLCDAKYDPERRAEHQKEHDRCERELRRLVRGLSGTEERIKNLIHLRNLTDEREQEFRQMESSELFRGARQVELSGAMDVLDSFRESLDEIDKKIQVPPGYVTLWRLVRYGRLKKANKKRLELLVVARKVGLDAAEDSVSEYNTSYWREFHEDCGERVRQAGFAFEYLGSLRDLQEAGSFEDLFAEAASLEGKIVKNSRRLWLAWLQMRSCGLDKSEKDALKQYLYLLSGVTGARNWSLNTSEWERYMSLWAEVSDLIGRWAVTSLSAKSSVPPLPNHFDIVVFDEASQCDIASALPLLYRARAAVVIGDPKQLPPISRLKQKQDERLLKKHGLYEEWSTWAHSSHSLHPSHSLYDLASMLDNPVASLREHYRSHSDIINFSNSEFYQRDLIIATRYGDLLHPAKGEFGIRWVDVRGRARRPRGGGAVNQEEAAAVVRELTRLVVESGYGGSVGVVSPFRVQAEKIGNLADAEVSLRKKLSERKSEILSDTVHRFQGDERDVIIFSPVVSEGMTETAFDFLRNNRKLFNVAVTRARAQLIVVGDRDACKKIDYLARLLKYIDSPADSAPETSDWERLLDEEMCGDGKISGSGVIIKRQHPVDGYYLDFALIIGERCLAIEVDGEYYHRDWNGDLCRRDQIRNRRLMELGWDVMRFWVYEIRDDMPRCIARIQEWLDGASGHGGGTPDS